MLKTAYEKIKKLQATQSDRASKLLNMGMLWNDVANDDLINSIQDHIDELELTIPIGILNPNV